MKRWVVSKLICPVCPQEQIPLDLAAKEERDEDIIIGKLTCPACGSHYPIVDGIAVLLPEKTRKLLDDSRGYNDPAMLSAYLWSHFCDLINDPQATDAYQIWSSSLRHTDGVALDVGCAVGRLTFELANTHTHAIGIDTSMAFIRKAREILTRRRLDFDLVIEGHLTEPCGCDFDEKWNFDGVDFIVADALALPFRSHEFATVSAINILEKVPDPIKHLEEVNRMLSEHAALFLFSDPFSWDPTVSSPGRWLGGNGNRRYPARGIDTMRRLFAGEYGTFDPPLTVTHEGQVAWKIRKTEHLWEHITSQYLVGRRDAG